jgi:hypothetical protein
LNLCSIQRKLILLGLFLVPFISIGELYALFSGQLFSQSSNLTGVFKFSKDIVFILLIFIGVIDFLLRDFLNRKALFYLLLTLILVLPPLLLSLGNEISITASGLRWIIPIALPVFIFRALTPNFLHSFSKYIYYLLLLHLFIQVLQMFFASSWYGTSAFGLNLRNPGLFLIPNTGAFFSVVSLYTSLFISDFNKNKKFFIILISAISVFLTLSGTGLVVFLCVIFFYFATREMMRWYLLLVPFGIIFFYFFAIFLSSRDANYLEQSGGTRLSIFMENFIESDFVSANFGFGTNTAVMLGKGEIMDSTFASVIVNLGYFGFFLVVSILLLFISYSIISGSKTLFVFLTIITLFSFTTIISEVYPVNLIMGVLFVYFMSPGFKNPPIDLDD